MNAIVAWLGGEGAVARWLTVATLVAARVAPLTLLAPWLAVRAAPVMVRTAILLALTVALTPLAAQAAPALPESALLLAVLATREALLGAVFALVTALPFFALDWAGRLTDTWRGASLAEVIAPPTGERTSPMGDLYLMLAIVVFIALGGHRAALAAFADGLVATPVGELSAGSSFGDVALGAARLVGGALAFAAAVAAPVALTIVLVEIALGLVSRAAPQLPLFFAGMPLRAALGIAAALLAMSLVLPELAGAFRDSISAARRLMSMLAP